MPRLYVRGVARGQLNSQSGVYPSGQRGQTVNLMAYAFEGSNPSAPNNSKPPRSALAVPSVRPQPSRSLVASPNSDDNIQAL